MSSGRTLRDIEVSDTLTNSDNVNVSATFSYPLGLFEHEYFISLKRYRVKPDMYSTRVEVSGLGCSERYSLDVYKHDMETVRSAKIGISEKEFRDILGLPQKILNIAPKTPTPHGN